ncbi:MULTISPECIES: ABC transporter ATP-binding protein [Eubacteriales]|uniref:ATP-binding cassette domain-containing protein n=1 Tax=Bittarella massiliensis (ex Durand et al. 2017) TaxID=1720313 RepID=A0AAQ1MDC0_9FIRM|nr:MULTISPECIES: ABC transporter ATP-binding protein [Eubacteriales]ERJ00009.1 ABC transporter, ATP-binding protein [Clostridium sp. ATCC 29733]MZL68838.1 ATP-binding cassette domain-containing protein [Bittarella massiliensis (ex Durand et al. 2017)]MZL80142.1 ATP-binding cassette domain-containing protein [Bittarella massiliensis (ex Durand et al. 2017)]SHG07736.1 ATP-binding cassette, subfamily B [Bittarella massiliensis (ex Durand et al. 2017)]
MSEKTTHRPRRGGPMGGGIKPAGEKAKNFKGTMGQLARYMRPYYLKIAIVFLFAIASTVFVVIGPKILGNATDAIVDGFVEKAAYGQIMEHLPEGAQLPEGTTAGQLLAQMPEEAKAKIPEGTLEKIQEMDLSHEPGIDFGRVGSILLWLLGLYALSAAFSYVQGFIMNGVSQQVSYNLRRDISQKINRLPLAYFDRQTHGEVLSRVTNDVDTVATTLNQSLTQMVTAVATLAGVLYMMLSISVWMTLVALVMLPISVGLISTVVKKSQKHFVGQQKYLGNVNGHIEEMYSGHNVIKVFNREDVSVKKFKKINRKLYDSAWKSQFLSGLMMPIMTFVGNLGYVGVCVLGGYLAVQGSISIGNIQSFIQYLRQFNQPISQMASIANVLQSTAAAAERVFEFLAETEEVPEKNPPKELGEVRGQVDFEDVSFGYRDDKIIIHDFTSHIQPGQRIAIVGPTGAGKTTIVKLLMRFYDVNGGAIKVDGVDIRDLRRSDLRDVFGMVLQDTWLYGGTIRENIRYGRLDATDEEVEAAGKAAHVEHFVKTLPGGYDAELNEEASNVSQGQKQLLTIARAMVSDPKILILDEATSSVDTRTEVRIQKAMNNLMKGRTSFIIAHRLSTIKDCDWILVMKDGDIIEQGTHDQLIEQGGFYKTMYNAQFEQTA